MDVGPVVFTHAAIMSAIVYSFSVSTVAVIVKPDTLESAPVGGEIVYVPFDGGELSIAVDMPVDVLANICVVLAAFVIPVRFVLGAPKPPTGVVPLGVPPKPP